MFNPAWYVNSRMDGFAVLVFFTADNSVRKFVPLRTTHLSGSLLGPFAHFTLTHTFRFYREQCPHTIEAFYRFPLPGDAAITGVIVSFGQTTITATLKAREDAEKDYEDAKAERKAAALLTQESQNVFTLRIAGIAPDEDVVVRTSYVQAGDPDGPGFTYRIPLTTPPRYVREDESHSRAMQAQPLDVFRDPGHRFSLEISSPDNGSLSSSSHILAKRDNVYLLSAGDVIPDQDCILNWKPVQEAERPSLLVYSDDPGHPHFLALITPPEKVERVYPRELIFLVDHSGSMEGAKWTAASRAVENLLKSLQPGDFFNLCLFESTSYWLWNATGPASPPGIEEALRFLADKRSGGTELGVALEQALGQYRTEGEISRHIIIITDAQVTDQSRILHLIKNERKIENPRRCSILCIDSAPNVALANAIARYGMGIVRFLTSSADGGDITTAVDNLISLWNAPAEINLTLEINRENVILPDRTIIEQKEGSTVFDIGDLVPGNCIGLYGRCGDGPSPCTFTLSSTQGRISAVAKENIPEVRFLFGGNVVNAIDHLINSGYSQDEIYEELSLLGYTIPKTGVRTKPLYHENIVDQSRKHLKELLIRESLAYGIASSETAFIAVRQDADRVVEESIIIPNALPSGWSEHFVKSSNPMVSMIMQPDGTLKAPKRRSRQFTSGGNLLDWVGGGEGIILPPRDTQRDKTEEPEKKGTGAYILPPRKSAEPTQLMVTLFKGRPVFSGGEAILFDSESKGNQNIIPRTFKIERIIFSTTQSSPEFSHLHLMLFVGDLVKQVLDIRLSDLESQGGTIAVNATRKYGAKIRLVLMDVSEKQIVAIPEISVDMEGSVSEY